MVTTALVPNDDPDRVMMVPPEVGPGLITQKTKKKVGIYKYIQH